MMGYQITFSYYIEGRPAETASGREEDERLLAVTPSYFRTLRIPILEGRGFEPSDREGGTPVVILSESLARKQWPNGGALGSRIRFSEELPWFEVVGIVGDTRVDGLDQPAPPALYLSYAQRPWSWMSWLALTIRTSGDPTSLAPAIRNELVRRDPTVLPERIATLRRLYSESDARRRFATVVFGGFAGVSLLLGLVGVYGVMSYMVAQRTRELSVRIALGAPRSTVAVGVVRRGIGLALAGILIGLGAALALSRFMATLVFGIGTRDATTFTVIPVVLLLVAGAAAYVPARRATRVDPMQALRTD